MDAPERESGSLDTGAPAELFDFVQQYLEDELEGRVGTLEDYLRRFPGLEEEIAQELESLREARREAGAEGPSRIGAYEVLALLGSGGQGEVYAASDTRIDRQVALKVLRSPLALSGSQRARFHREAEVVARLNHPGICPVFEADTDGGFAYIAMPLLPGETLRAILEREKGRRPELPRVLETVERLARALHVAHEAGVVHRDVKPGNVMIAPDGAPTLLDFGLASSKGDDRAHSVTGAILGTPAYLAPEVVARGTKAAGPQADVYALGVILFEWLAGRPPFESPTRAGLLAAIVGGDAPDLRALAPGLPRDLAVVVATAMAPELSRRYAGARALADELARLRRGEPVEARPIGPLTRLLRWSRRRPTLAAVLGLALVGLAACLVLWREAVRARSSYDLVAGATEVARLVEESEDLWPLEPERAPALRAWVARVEGVASRLPRLEEELASMRREARLLPGNVAVGPPPAPTGEDPPARADRWILPDVSSQFRHDVLADYVRELAALAEPTNGLVARVRRRAEFLESVRQATSERFAERWREARGRVLASPRYGGLELAPQLGLVPLGPDPRSGLEEFVDLFTTAAARRSDPIPARDDGGALVITRETGVVFVLVPGGDSRMGSWLPDDPAILPGDPVDPHGEYPERPVSRVRLDPFLLSKYELTQDQWRRITHESPSSFPEGDEPGPLPVDFVTWEEARLWTTRLLWNLPTEAQWEWAARAGTLTPWSSGEGRDSLQGCANVAGSEFRNSAGASRVLHEEWNDGHEGPWPVGTGKPNRWGLHDVHGNLWEWCRDWFVGYEESRARPGDGLRTGPSPLGPIYRGGSWLRDAYWARCAARLYNRPDYRRNEVGLRPMRSLL